MVFVVVHSLEVSWESRINFRDMDHSVSSATDFLYLANTKTASLVRMMEKNLRNLGRGKSKHKIYLSPTRPRFSKAAYLNICKAAQSRLKRHSIDLMKSNLLQTD